MPPTGDTTPWRVAEVAALRGDGLTARRHRELPAKVVEEVRTEGRPDAHSVLETARTVVALRQLSLRHPSAATVLSACAMLAPDPFPLRACVPALPAERKSGRLPRTRAAVAEALATLDRYALAQARDGSLTLYPLTRVLLRGRSRRSYVDSHVPSVTDAEVRALLIAAAPGQVSDPATWPTWARLLPHLLAVDPAVLSDSRAHDVAREACWYAMDRGDHCRALGRLDELHRIWSRELGLDHPDTWRTMTYLARAADAAGDPTRACSLAEDVFARRRRVLGADHPDTLLAAHGLASRWATAGRQRDALRLAEDVLARRTRLLGPGHPDTVAVRETAAVIKDTLNSRAESRP
ncbi:tetratricopeptide repeat protein [Streptantibioticus ferralitis]|uniref:Tetratricopeptide repeat protein n=1 Tax=Streptantibioticus ferralitis TaxID=236510 RepID=A0ABT5ZBK4_9ACTN|nr:tetratricopeptide repeat protein [Streptantibioticus ferralitis]MDF2261017.1 tetratricopeptide repeat protein [Streptantibioticus ferralitis]